MKDRADKILTELGLTSSRSQAKSLIDKGDVLVNGTSLKKAGDLISKEDQITINSPMYVGRGAFKLEMALEVFHVDVNDKTFLDVGASTGGFTEVLLKKGAKKVYAIDVGYGQLAQKLRDDERVVNLERTNIRELSSLPEKANGAVMDLSFISIIKVLDNVKKLLLPGSVLVALIKPQFEAGPERIPKDGVIKNERIRQEILNEVITFVTQNGWEHLQTIDSPIEGKSGNKEYLALLRAL